MPCSIRHWSPGDSTPDSTVKCRKVHCVVDRLIVKYSAVLIYSTVKCSGAYNIKVQCSVYCILKYVEAYFLVKYSAVGIVQ